jgi:hypothetical protein
MSLPKPKWQHLGLAIALLAALTLARGWLAWHSPEFKFADEHLYLDIASHIASENKYTITSPGNPIFAVRQAPGLPVTLGAVGKVVPLSPLTAKAMNGLASILTAVMYALIVLMLTRQWAAAVVMLLLAGLHPPLLYTSLTNYPQTLQGFWLAVLTLVWSQRLSASPSPRAGALDGGLIGIGALFVPTQLFIAPAALAFHWRQGRSWLIRYAAWAIAGGVLVLTPWTLRNLAVERAFIPFSTNGGEQLYLGFNSQAGMNTGIQIATPDALRTAVRQSSSGKEAESVYRHAALEWINEHPGRSLRLWILKSVNFFRWDNGNMMTRSEQSASRDWIARMTSLGVFGLALAGAWHSRKRRSPWAWTAAVLMLGLALGHAFFISRYRYRLPFEPFLIMTGIIGIFTARQPAQATRETTR